MSLNRTLLGHLPSEFLVKYEGQEWRLTGLALENVYRRIRLDHADDVLIESEFVSTVNDLCSLPGGDTFSYSDLSRYMKYGLIVPRYRVKPKRFFLTVSRTLIYSPDGLLQKIEIGPFLPHLRRKNRKVVYRHPEAANNFPPFQGQIVENPPPISPDFREAKRSGPLFVFSQVGRAKELHQSTRWTVDLLAMTPERYVEMRREWFAGLKECFGRDGNPKFCENEDCPMPIPQGHKRYCSPECQGRAIRARQPKSTARVAKSYQKKAPLPSFNGSPILPEL